VELSSPVSRKGARDTSGRVARRDQYAVEFGWIGGRFASLIIVPPQTAIKGAGQISQEVAAHLDQGALRRLLALHP
jgi:hypothetical protein